MFIFIIILLLTFQTNVKNEYKKTFYHTLIFIKKKLNKQQCDNSF